MDFVSDQLTNGRRFRVLNIVDDYSRECVLQLVDFSISGLRLARELDRLKRQLPKTIVCEREACPRGATVQSLPRRRCSSGQSGSA